MTFEVARYRAHVLQLCITLAAVEACHAQQRVDSASIAKAPSVTVPLVPPAATPKATWDSLVSAENVLISPPSYAGRLVRNALWVRFVPTAAASDRAEAIASVEGELVGGTRLNSRDGYFLVRIPTRASIGDSTSGPVLRAQRRLKAHASITSVLLVTPDRNP
jgi:hypothetical protein